MKHIMFLRGKRFN